MKEKVFATLDNVKRKYLTGLEQARIITKNEFGKEPSTYDKLRIYLLSIFLDLRIELAKALMEETHNA